MTTTVQIGPLRPADAARCAELERILFPGDDPWTERAFRDELNAGHHYVAARRYTEGPDTEGRDAAPIVGGELAGYAGLAFVAGPPRAEAEIHTIGVDPAQHRRGIGRTMLRALLEVADAATATVFLEVRTDNAAARALYEAESFTVVGIRKRYYRPSGADAYTMRREPR
jgi:[ribosomal protein S18]-alanine N-acetyltransferase